ncbi:ORFL310W [Human betaherpesvirus 5]|nr:ORFL310W [Human betaherpesvirus 5]
MLPPSPREKTACCRYAWARLRADAVSCRR